jgi:hypothetical protein
MSSILKSASRIWMLLSILVTCIVFFYVVVMNVTTESVVMWVLTIFTNLMTGITVFYYTKKQSNPDVDKI